MGQNLDISKNSNNSLIRQVIKDKWSVSFHRNQQRPFQLFQVMRNQGLGELQFLHNTGNGFLPIT